MKFRLKPEIVEAFQFIEDSPLPPGATMNERGSVYVDTARGRLQMRIGDWIVTEETGVKRLYPPDVFEQLYEKTDDSQGFEKK